MITMAQVAEAHRQGPQQRFGLRKLLRVNAEIATPEEKALADRVMAITSTVEYDKSLADKAVGELFRRGVLFFERVAP